MKIETVALAMINTCFWKFIPFVLREIINYRCSSDFRPRRGWWEFQIRQPLIWMLSHTSPLIANVKISVLPLIDSNQAAHNSRVRKAFIRSRELFLAIRNKWLKGKVKNHWFFALIGALRSKFRERHFKWDSINGKETKWIAKWCSISEGQWSEAH